MVSQSPRENRRAIQLKLTAPIMGAGFPYQLWFVVNRETYGECLRLLYLNLINNVNMNKIVIGLLLCVSIPMWSEDTKVKVGDLYYTLNGAYASVAMNCIDINFIHK